MRGGGHPGGWGPCSWACAQAAQGGLRVRPGNGFRSLERLRGGGRGLDGLCGEATHRLGQASCSITHNQRSPKTTSWEKNGCGIMAKSPRSVAKRRDFTQCSGRSNYPQRRGTRPRCLVRVEQANFSEQYLLQKK